MTRAKYNVPSKEGHQKMINKYNEEIKNGKLTMTLAMIKIILTAVKMTIILIIMITMRFKIGSHIRECEIVKIE